jgi:hypothetical protein
VVGWGSAALLLLLGGMALPFLWQQFVHWRYDPSIHTV